MHTKTTVLLCAVMLGACSAVTSHGPKSKMANGEASAAEGFSYYLPMRQLKLTYERFEVEKDAKEKLDQAKANLKSANATLEAAKHEETQAKQVFEDLLKLPGVNSEQLSLSRVVLSKATIATAAAADKQQKVEAAATKAQVAFDAALKNDDLCGFADRFSVTLLPPVADPASRYVANIDHFPTRSDELALKTSPAGLLSSVSSTAADETAEIIVALAAGRAAVRVPSVPQLRTTVPHPTVTAAELRCKDSAGNNRVKPIKISWIVNPALQSQFQDFGTAVSRAAKVDVTPQDALFDTNYEVLLADPQTARFPCSRKATIGKRDVGAGIAYRRNRPYTLSFLARKGTTTSSCAAAGAISTAAGCQVVDSMEILIPNFSPIELLPLRASLFGKASAKFEFQDGILVSFDTTRPSEIGRAAAIPVDYAKAILSVPAEIVQLKVDLRSKEQSLTEADAAALRAEIDRLKAIQELQDAASETSEEDPLQ